MASAIGLHSHPYSAQQIFQRLREQGCVMIVRDYVRRIRGTRAAGLSEAPLRSRRVRAGRLGRPRNGHDGQYKPPAIVLRHGTGHGRQMFVEFTVSQTMKHA